MLGWLARNLALQSGLGLGFTKRSGAETGPQGGQLGAELCHFALEAGETILAGLDLRRSRSARD